MASAIEKVPSGERWHYEIKFDGYRVQVHPINQGIKVFTRRGHDWTARFRKIADDAWHLSAGSAIIDGEIVVPAADGTTDFSVLQNELKNRSRSCWRIRPTLLERPRSPEAAAHRAEVTLEEDVAGTDNTFSESFEDDGQEVFGHSAKVGLEGIASKVRDSCYSSGRGNDRGQKDLLSSRSCAL